MSDLLHPRVGPLGLSVHLGVQVAGRLGKAVGPPAGRCVEDDVGLGAWIRRRGVNAAVGFSRGVLRGAGGHDFEALDRRRITVPFPADEAGDPVALLHLGIPVDPMVRPRANPVGAAGNRPGAVRANQFIGVGPLVRKRAHGHKFAGASRRAVHTNTLKGPQLGVALQNTSADSIAREEAHAHASQNRRLDVAVHLNRPVLVVADAQEAIGAQQTGAVEMRVGVGDVAHVIAVGLKPVHEGVLPQEELPGTDGERLVYDLAVLAIRPVEAHPHTTAPVPLVLAVVVERELGGPAVVGLPGVVGALEQVARLALIADNEDDVALDALLELGELGHVDAADPILGDQQLGTRLPLAEAIPLRSHLGVGLGATFERAHVTHESTGLPAVKAHAVDVDGEVRRRIGADVEGQVLARTDAGPRGVALDPRASVAGRRVDPGLGEHPIASSRVQVLEPDLVQPTVMGQRSCGSAQRYRAGRPGHRFHRRPTGDRVRVHHLPQSLTPTIARCTWRVPWRVVCRQNPDRARSDGPGRNRGRSCLVQRRVLVLVQQILAGKHRIVVGLSVQLVGVDETNPRGRRRSKKLGRCGTPENCPPRQTKFCKIPKDPACAERRIGQGLQCARREARDCRESTKKTQNQVDAFFLIGQLNVQIPSAQRFPQLSRPPRNHRHASRHHPRPQDRYRHPGDRSVPRRAGGEEWGVQGGCGEVAGRLWGGCGEVVGRLWGGCGRAVIRTYIIGHIGVHPLAAVHAEIAINQICQSNQKNRRPK